MNKTNKNSNYLNFKDWLLIFEDYKKLKINSKLVPIRPSGNKNFLVALANFAASEKLSLIKKRMNNNRTYFN